MHRILCLVSLLAAFSCQKWKPTVEQIAELCGPELQGQPIMLFREPDGDRLYTDESYDFSVYFQSSAGHWRQLAVNSQGCVVPPQEDGTLVARSLSQGWAYARSHDSVFPRYEEVEVSEAQVSSWELDCPASGWIADSSLPDVVRYAGSNSEVFDVQIKARSSEGPLQLLSQKKIGLGLTEPLPLQDVNLRNLEAGLYELHLFVGFAGPEAPSRPLSTCPLEIVRHEPTFAQDPWRDGDILRLSEKRSFTPTVAGDRLMICRSPGHQSGPENPCAVGPLCQDRKNFAEADALTVEEPGPWTYAYFLKNRAGREGPLHCRRIYGSERAPEFDLRWQNARWNERGTILAALPAHMEAAFERQGHSRDGTRPAPSFSCKVDFVHDTNVIVGQGVRCLSGLCAGQSLKDFVPCSSPLRLEASQAFESQLLLNSEMRLTVRADDGAGQIASRTRSLLLQHSQNFIFSTAKSLPNLQRGDKVGGFWPKPDGGLLVFIDGNKVDRFLELPRSSGGMRPEKWREIPNPGAADESVHLALVSISETNTVMVSWLLRSGSSLRYRTLFSRLDQGSWTEVVPQAWDSQDKICSYFLAEDAANFLCYNTGNSGRPELLRLSLNKDPETLPMPDLPGQCRRSITLTSPPFTWLRNARKENFIICHQEAAFRLPLGGNWERYPLPPDKSLSLHTITLDEQEQPWFVMKKGPDAVIAAPTRMSGTIPFPENLEGPVTTNESLGFDAAGQLRLGAYVWNGSDARWVRDESLVNLLGTAAIQVRPIQGERGALFFESPRFTLMRDAAGQDRLFPLKSLQWSQPYFDSLTRPQSMGVKPGPQGELCFSERVQNVPHIRCLLRKNWAQLGYPGTQLDAIPEVKHIVSSSSGQFLLATDEGFYKQEGSSWIQVSPPVPEKNTLISWEGDSLWAIIKNKSYRMKLAENVWQLVSQTDETAGQLTRTTARNVFTDSLGQVWINNRTQMSGRFGSRTLVKFNGDTRGLVSYPDTWNPFEIFPLGSELIFLNEVTEAGQKQIKIHAMDVSTHTVRDYDPRLLNFDLSVFANRNITALESSAHEQAAVIYDDSDRSFEPIILDFRLKRQLSLRDFGASTTLAGLGFARLRDDSYLVITAEKLQSTSLVENSSFRRVLPDGRLQFLYDTDDLRTMEERAALRVNTAAPVLGMDGGSRLWITPSEVNSTRPPEIFQFDLEALTQGQPWKSR